MIDQNQIQKFANEMMEGSGSNNIPNTIRSPLGRDNPEEISLSQEGDAGSHQGKGDQDDGVPPSHPDVEPQTDSSDDASSASPNPLKGEPTLSTEAQRKAEYYDLLMRNPRTREAIETSLASQFGEVPDRSSSQTSRNTPRDQDPENYVSKERFEELERNTARIASAYSNLVLDNMRSKYPDFQSLETDMIPIARANPNLSPEQLYYLAKASKSNGRTVEQRKSTTLPTEKGPGGGGGRTSEQSADPVAAAVEKARSLPQGPRRTEDALRLVYEAALEREGNA